MDEAGSRRSHLNWRNDWMGSSSFLWQRWPYAMLDRDNTQGNGVPETVTFFSLDKCEQDCHFVYRVWDYCSSETALSQLSGAVARLYNSASLHSTYHINEHGIQHNGSNLDAWRPMQLLPESAIGQIVALVLLGPSALQPASRLSLQSARQELGSGALEY